MVENQTNIFIYQTEDGNTKIDVRLEDETAWMTQKAIAELYQTTPQNITLHIKNIMNQIDNCSKYFVVTQKEGTREIQRKILHYNLDVIFNIGVKGQYFEEINELIEFTRKNNIRKEYYKIVPVKERVFGELLFETLKDVVEIISQYKVGTKLIDFYIPALNLAIEYDERHHEKQVEEDKIRQAYIEKETGINFVRIDEGKELEGLNIIIKHVLRKKDVISSHV